MASLFYLWLLSSTLSYLWLTLLLVQTRKPTRLCDFSQAIAKRNEQLDEVHTSLSPLLLIASSSHLNSSQLGQPGVVEAELVAARLYTG